MKSQIGQTLLEVVIALGIIVVVSAAFVGLATNSVRNSSFSRNQVNATQLAQEAIEAMITIRDQNTQGSIRGNGGNDQWVKLFPPFTTSSMICSEPRNPAAVCSSTDFILASCTIGSPATEQRCIDKNTSGERITVANTSFTRKIRISDPSPSQANVKDVTVFVTWTDAQGLHKSVITRKLHRDNLE